MQSVVFGASIGFVVMVLGKVVDSPPVAITGILLLGTCLVVNLWTQDAT